MVVVAAELGQHLLQTRPVEAVDAGIDQRVAALLFAAVAMLDDLLNGAVAIEKHTAVARRVLEMGRQEGDGCPAAAVFVEQGFKGLRA